jgi:hypothetical protein
MYVDRAMRIFLQAIISPLDPRSLSNKKGGDWRQEETPPLPLFYSHLMWALRNRGRRLRPFPGAAKHALGLP